MGGAAPLGQSFAMTTVAGLNEGPIRMGDFISLFVEELHGFMSADGFTDEGLYVKCLREDEVCVLDPPQPRPALHPRSGDA